MGVSLLRAKSRARAGLFTASPAAHRPTRYGLFVAIPHARPVQNVRSFTHLERFRLVGISKTYKQQKYQNGLTFVGVPGGIAKKDSSSFAGAISMAVLTIVNVVVSVTVFNGNALAS
jgi:hypothetical protein